MNGSLPFEGVRVLELGNYIAGPTAGRLLADFGAEVIKVERPHTGDELRRWRLHAGSTSMLFHTVNRNKKSIVIDLKTDEGRSDVVRLAAQCDVVVENFRPGTLEKWGIGPEVLTAANPSLIVARISAFGQTGPLSSRPGFAAVAEAFGGLRAVTGDSDRPPVRTGVSIGDSLAGIYAAFGVAMSLLRRERHDGEIPLTQPAIDVALHETIFSVMESLVPDYLAYGVERTRLGGQVEGIAPSNAYLCADGRSVVIAGNGDAIFRRYMHVIGRPDLAEDPDLATAGGRWRRRDELDRAIAEWTGRATRAEVLAAADAAGIPAGPILTAPEIADTEQYVERKMIQYFPVDTGAAEPRLVGFPGIVPLLGAESLPNRTIGPELGEHTDEIRQRFLAIGQRP